MKKGFTLIELLAVIVILAIIALIATPIVLEIINDSKQSATLRSAEFYLDGVELAVSQAILDNKSIKDGTYSIMEDGNICIGKLEDNTCNQIEGYTGSGYKLEVSVKGEKPTSGTIKIEGGEIVKSNITISNKVVGINTTTGKIEYKLAPGLYDENDKLLASWDELDDLASAKGLNSCDDLSKVSDFKDAIEAGEYCDYDEELDMKIPTYAGISNIISSIKGANKLVIDEGVTWIGDRAFEGLKLTEIIIPDTVTSIGDSAFEDCTKLIKITIPSSVLKIGSNAFTNCKNLTTVTLEEGLEIIGREVFSGCTNLTSITIPSTVISINDNPFWSCSSLESIIVDPNNKVYDSRDNSNAIIKTSNNSLIAGCKNTVIPNTVTGIGGTAFWGQTGLIEIMIPESVTKFDGVPFDGCRNLTTIYYKGTATINFMDTPNVTIVTDF